MCSTMKKMVSTNSNEFEVLKLALVDARRLEKVDKYYVQKLAEIGILLSRYCRFLQVNEMPVLRTPSLNSIGLYQADTAYGMENRIKNKFSVYPNPFDNRITIE